MDQSKIGKFIASLRKEQNMTQFELAEKMGVSNRAVSKWETGKSMPDSGIMLELCEILKINVNELLSGERINTGEYYARAEEKMIELSEKNERRSNSDNSLLSVMTLIFVVLKLKKKIDWPWVWVLSPIWIPLIIAGGLVSAAFTIGEIQKRKRYN